MYSRLLKPPKKKSFFLFGPRGVGKTSWVKDTFPKSVYIDLLDTETFADLLAQPTLLKKWIPDKFNDWIVIDEIQKIPELLNEVHRLIENERYCFILTGSSARALRRRGTNLLAGRALRYTLHPLIASEYGDDFNLKRSLMLGNLPAIHKEEDPKKYLSAYVKTYLQEEVVQEGITRNLRSFRRFLEAASFSQASILNITHVARECGIERKAVENYFDILEDLLLASRLPVFTKKAKRRMIGHPKFFYFDAGVYQILRPQGPLDLEGVVVGAALETLFFHELRAINDYFDLAYQLYYWHTASDLEVDFVAYGEKGLHAFELKSARKVHPSDLKGLQAFKDDFPVAKLYFIYAGSEEYVENNIHFLPLEKALFKLPQLLS